MGKKLAMMKWALTSRPRRQPDPIMTIYDKLRGDSYKDGRTLMSIPLALVIGFGGLWAYFNSVIALIPAAFFVIVFLVGLRASIKIEHDEIRENAKKFGIEKLLEKEGGKSG